jgi:hypothetical protein
MHRKSQNGVAKQPATARVPVTVRLPEKIVQQIDAELDQRDIPLSRNNWLLEHFHLRYIVDSAVTEPGLGVFGCDLG